MLKKKLLIIVAIVFILAFGLFYWLNFRNNTAVDSADSDSQISPEILKLIGPPPGYDASKVSEPDPEILKLIGPPPGYKPPESNEISPEILKLIGPPTSTNQ